MIDIVEASPCANADANSTLQGSGSEGGRNARCAVPATTCHEGGTVLGTHLSRQAPRPAGLASVRWAVVLRDGD